MTSKKSDPRKARNALARVERLNRTKRPVSPEDQLKSLFTREETGTETPPTRESVETASEVALPKPGMIARPWPPPPCPINEVAPPIEVTYTVDSFEAFCAEVQKLLYTERFGRRVRRKLTPADDILRGLRAFHAEGVGTIGWYIHGVPLEPMITVARNDAEVQAFMQKVESLQLILLPSPNKNYPEAFAYSTARRIKYTLVLRVPWLEHLSEPVDLAQTGLTAAQKEFIHQMNEAKCLIFKDVLSKEMQDKVLVPHFRNRLLSARATKVFENDPYALRPIPGLDDRFPLSELSGLKENTRIEHIREEASKAPRRVGQEQGAPAYRSGMWSADDPNQEWRLTIVDMARDLGWKQAAVVFRDMVAKQGLRGAILNDYSVGGAARRYVRRTITGAAKSLIRSIDVKTVSTVARQFSAVATVLNKAQAIVAAEKQVGRT